ncbi:MAG: YwaF family protein [Clostridiales bacterium]|nr:YwaF family protein [Clostridiales bacterium]
MGLYSTHHIIFIVLAFVCLVAAVLVFKLALKTDKAKDIFIRCLGGVLTVSLIMNRISITVWNNTGLGALNLIPQSYCGMTSLLLGLFATFGKKDMKVFHFLVYVEILGGLATIFYPNFLDQGPSFFFMPTITGMNHHACGLILCVILILGKWFEPSFKRWYVFPIGLSIYTLFGLFLIDPLGIPGSMNIDEPLISGTPLKWWFVLIVGTAVVAGFTFVYDLVKARLAKNKNVAAAEQTATTDTPENTETPETENS